ncbi:MAG: deoxyribose-phosphate aldolase [Fervidobacterium sp.]|uniref:Deoxyribose-phosphate aldolase n=1 Tax=Fervidobacterium gondwanense DSM 13020 TaxID=1121883 RepID=A0A1M7RTX6_FERGO|nr:deoxyribose-phosphate aldolase [Fervidobacterium gondwanense]UXF01894.1 deoxyribose-phosphate aldolase [Fervidobacterium riparium]SHN49745.1 deoxyribose-phosphate aldolase [Fervidobacterium gondwanense DSM 13020]
MDIRKKVEEKLRSFKESYKPDVIDIDPSKININTYIDHTNLKPTATTEEIKAVCKEALEYKFKGVCINPSFVPMVSQMLKGSDVLTVTVVGFPLGATSTHSKVEETKWAVENGAQEIDMVIHIGKLREGDYEYVYNDIKSIVEAAKVPVKVIIETCFLTDEEKVAASVISKLAGAKFVKTSTGFGTGGAKFEDVQLMRWAVDGEIEVKASGGVKTYEDALKMLSAGATRIGTSSGVAIVTRKTSTSGGY